MAPFFSIRAANFSNVKSRALSQLALLGVWFGKYSFWIGAVSTAAAMGCSPSWIRQIRRWHSVAYKGYVRLAVL